MPHVDRLRATALLSGFCTLLLVGVGGAKRVLAVSTGPLEDLNRALGALLGVCVLAVFVLALARRSAVLAGLAAVALGSVGAAGWLGVRGAALAAPALVAGAQVGVTALEVASLALVWALAAPPPTDRPVPSRRAVTAVALALTLAALGALALTDGTPPLARAVFLQLSLMLLGALTAALTRSMRAAPPSG